MYNERFDRSVTFNTDKVIAGITDARLRALVAALLKDIEAADIAYRCRVRNAPRAQVIKIRSINTNSELFFVSRPTLPDSFVLRFYRYVDRYKTTLTARQVVRQMSFDMQTEKSRSNAANFLSEEGLAWLYPSADNLKPPQAHFMLLIDTDQTPTPHVGVGFQIASARVRSSTDTDAMIIVTNRKGTVSRELPMAQLSAALSLDNVVGRYYVEFHNKDNLVLTEEIFHQQFAFMGTPAPAPYERLTGDSTYYDKLKKHRQEHRAN